MKYEAWSCRGHCTTATRSIVLLLAVAAAILPRGLAIFAFIAVIRPAPSRIGMFGDRGAPRLRRRLDDGWLLHHRGWRHAHRLYRLRHLWRGCSLAGPAAMAAIATAVFRA